MDDLATIDAAALAAATGCTMSDALALIPGGSVLVMPPAQLRRLRSDRRYPTPLPTAVASALVGLTPGRLTGMIAAGDLPAARTGLGPWEVLPGDLAALRRVPGEPGRPLAPPRTPSAARSAQSAFADAAHPAKPARRERAKKGAKS